MFPVSKLMDRAIETQFLKDSSGRTVFVPFSLTRNCYFLDTEADQDKIRAFVRMYRNLFQIIALLSYPSVFIPALILEDFAGLSPRGHRLTIALGIPLFFLGRSWRVGVDTLDLIQGGDSNSNFLADRGRTGD